VEVQTEWRYRQSGGTWFIKTHFSGARSSSDTENAYETPKSDHANSPTIIIIIYIIILYYNFNYI